MDNELKFSVLIPIYYKENPEYFNTALESIVNQTLMPNEIVIVKDGPLTKELNSVMEKYISKYPQLFNIISLEKNVGLGEALRIGVEKCSFDIIARMDSDDISRVDRFKTQIDFLENNPEIDIVGSWISEFEGNKNNIISHRELPIKHEEIYKFGQFRCPMNHMTVMFKKQAVLKAGNYKTFKNIEDYYLWGRMLINGAKFANIPECLVNVRAGNAMFKRRANLTYFFNSELPLQIEFLKIGFTNIYQFLRNSVLKFLLRAMPLGLMSLYYKKFLRTVV